MATAVTVIVTSTFAAITVAHTFPVAQFPLLARRIAPASPIGRTLPSSLPTFCQSVQRTSEESVRASLDSTSRSVAALRRFPRLARLPRCLSLLAEEGGVVAVDLADNAREEALVGLRGVRVRTVVSLALTRREGSSRVASLFSL